MQVDEIKHLRRMKWATGKHTEDGFEVWGLFPDEESAQWSADDSSCDCVPLKSLESAYVWDEPCK